jgi:hypothetical protein
VDTFTAGRYSVSLENTPSDEGIHLWLNWVAAMCYRYCVAVACLLLQMGLVADRVDGMWWSCRV